MKAWELSRSTRFTGTLVVLAGALLANPPAGAQTRPSGPDFTLSVAPASATVQPGSSERYTLTVTGDHGFAGTVHVGLSGVSPQVVDGPIFSLARYDVPVSKTLPSGTVRLTALTKTSTPAGTYTITITGKDISGGSQYGLTRSTTFTLSVE
jgi:hypothetical protein